jgi:hypothetical protein
VRNKNLTKLYYNKGANQTRWVLSFSHHFVTQTRTDLWTLLHLVKYYKPIYELWCIYHIWIWSLTKKSYFNVRHVFFVQISVASNFSRNISKPLNKGDWCFNKSANQTKVVLDNKVSMSPTLTRPIGYQWRWSRMTKCIWLTKLWNFERVPSNLLARLIYSFFGWGCVAERHFKEVEA